MFKTKSTVQRCVNSLHACSTAVQSCVLDYHQPNDMANGLLRGSARNGRQHIITFASFSRAWCLEGDREETFAALSNSDGAAAKTTDILQAIFDLDVKSLSWPGVIHHKHHESASSSWYGELVSGIKDSD